MKEPFLYNQSILQIRFKGFIGENKITHEMNEREFVYNKNPLNDASIFSKLIFRYSKSNTNEKIYRLSYYMIFSWIHPLIKRAWNNEQFSLNELYSIINSDESEELTDQLEK